MQPLTLDWLHIVALLGATQGFFLAGVLATQMSVQSDIPVHWRSPSVLGEPAHLPTAGRHLPAETAILLSH